MAPSKPQVPISVKATPSGELSYIHDADCEVVHSLGVSRHDTPWDEAPEFILGRSVI